MEPKCCSSGPKWRMAHCGRRPRRGPVLTKCCLRASGRGAGGADSKVHVNSNEGRRQNPRDAHKPRGQQNGKKVALQQPGECSLVFVAPGAKQPRGCVWPLGEKISLPSPQTDSGAKRKDIWKTSLFWEKGLWRQEW